jgi:4'-phosphopantetheinyl transferase
MPLSKSLLDRDSLEPLPANAAHVWYAWTEACRSPDAIHYYTTLLSDTERKRMESFRFDSLRLEYLITRALCRLTLSRYAEVPPEGWLFVANSHGRPRIHPAMGIPTLHFNLSNARELIACIVTTSQDAGVDVENARRLQNPISLAEHCFSQSEIRELHKAPQEHQHRKFFEIWTLKEAYIKARGMGLAIPLDQFWFSLNGEAISIQFGPELPDDPRDWQFEQRWLADSYVMALALRKAASAKFQIVVRQGLPL